MRLRFSTALALCALGCGAASCGRVDFDPIAPHPGGAMTVEPAFPGSAAWNSYVQREADLPPHELAGTPCLGSETGPRACLHAGELRWVAAPAFASCAGAEVRDALDVFAWTCHDDTIPVRFTTTGLRPGRGLRDLVTAAGWRANHVIINDHAGPPTTWWDNPVLALSAVSPDAVTVLDVPGAIYVVPATTTTGGIRIASDRVALVVALGARLRPGTPLAACAPSYFDRTCLVELGERAFTWIEGELDAEGAAGTTVYGRRSAHFRIHGAILARAGEEGLLLIDNHNYRITDTTIEGAGGIGLFAPLSADHELVGVRAIGNGLFGIAISDMSSSGYVVRDVVVARNASAGLWSFNGGTGTVVGVVATHNGGHGIHIEASASPVISDVISAGNDGDGIRTGAGTSPTLSHALLAANAGAGLRIDPGGGSYHQVVTIYNGDDGIYLGGTPSDPITMTQLVTAHNAGAGVRTVDTPAVFHENLLIGANDGGTCVVSGAAGLVDGSCAAAGVSTHRVVTRTDLVADFLGRVAVDDAVNRADTAGAAAAAVVTDWWGFESRFRTWLRDGTPPPPGACAGGTCRIWDWRLRAIGTTLVGRSADGSTPGAPIADGEPCPPEVAGDRAALRGGQPFLVNARELLDDHVGDDDGLCEAGERCVASPSFGPYQGAGKLRGPCVFTAGAVTGVTLYGFDQRGEP